MRAPIILLATIAILLAGCSSTPEEPTPAANGNSGSAAFEGPEKPANVANVTGRALRVEWRNLNPRNGDQMIGLINRSSPELAQLYRNPQAFAGVKPIDDEVMANILGAYQESGFYDIATEGADVRSFSMGDGNGVVSLIDGDRKYALFFPRMTDPTEARSSPIPRTYRDLKVLLISVYNSTLWLAPSAPQDPNRVFKAPTPDRKR